MVTIEQIDEFRKRTNSSYEEARFFLEKTNGDVLEAIIAFEEMKGNGKNKKKSHHKGEVSENIAEVLQKGFDFRLVIEDLNKQILFSVPVLLLVVLVPFWMILLLACLGLYLLDYRLSFQDMKNSSVNMKHIFKDIAYHMNLAGTHNQSKHHEQNQKQSSNMDQNHNHSHPEQNVNQNQSVARSQNVNQNQSVAPTQSQSPYVNNNPNMKTNPFIHQNQNQFHKMNNQNDQAQYHTSNNKNDVTPNNAVNAITVHPSVMNQSGIEQVDLSKNDDKPQNHDISGSQDALAVDRPEHFQAMNNNIEQQESQNDDDDFKEYTVE